MADNDELRRKIASCWHRPYDAAKSDASPQEVAQLCRPTAAKFFQRHGCPLFSQLRELVEPWCASGGQVPLFGGCNYQQAEEKCRQLLMSRAGGATTVADEHAVKACLYLILEAQMDGFHDGDAGLVLASRIVTQITASDFLDKLTQSKILERFEMLCEGDTNAASQALFDYKCEIESLLPKELEEVARKLADDPSGQNVRVRPVRMPKRSTAELIEQRLD